MLRCSILILLASLLLFSCRSSDSFAHRKYLPGVFREHDSQNRNSITQNTEQPSPSATVVSNDVNQSSAEVLPQEITLADEETDFESRVPAFYNIESTALQPQDTLPKSKRQLRREFRRTDTYRSRASFTLGIESIIAAVLFTLLGLWLGSDGVWSFTNDIFLFIFLILIVIPVYFALGVASLLNSILSIFFGTKVRRKHQGEETYEGEKATRMGIILSLIGLALLTLGAILTLPHFLDW